jgi:hypothetical protein
MLRLRCYLFGKLVREHRDRVLVREEREFLDRHRLECEECRIREVTTQCSLEALKSVEVEPESGLTTQRIVDAIERAKKNLGTT